MYFILAVTYNTNRSSAISIPFYSILFLRVLRKSINVVFAYHIELYIRYNVSSHLEADLFVQGDWSVAEGDSVAKAGLSFDRPLSHVHDDL